MSVEPEEMNEATDFGAVATAPGSIPLPIVERRHAYLSHQFRHDNTLRPLAPKPGEPVLVSATSGIRIEIAAAELWYTTNGTLPDAQARRLPLQAVDMSWDPRASYITHWQVEIPGQAEGTAVRYTIAGWKNEGDRSQAPDFLAQDGQGIWFQLADGSPITTFAYTVTAAETGPAWMAEAVIYHIFLDRYHPGSEDGRFADNPDPNGIHGGSLRGVTRSLPHLTDLGINCIWLSPLNIAPTYHRYDATDLFTIDPALGSDEDLRDLVDQAHARGIRVILDFVPSHISWQHPAFQAAQADREAETASWFVFTEWPDEYRSFLGMIPTLVSINTNDPGARRHLIDNALYWIRQFDVDGFRIDHVIGHGMDFWVELQQALTAVKPDVVTIGEATDSPDALRRYKGRLTHLLDFPLAGALRMTFATGEWSLTEFDRFLETYIRFMAEGPTMASFLDNHDMNRFLFLAGGDTRRLKIGALLQFSLAATPIIYYGTEIGLSQMKDKDDEGFGGDHQVRLDMPWDKMVWDQDLLSFYKCLIHLRQTEPDLRDGRHQRHHLEASTQTYGVQCGDRLLLLINLSEKTQMIPLNGAGKCLLATGDQPQATEMDVTLPPVSAALFEFY